MGFSVLSVIGGFITLGMRYEYGEWTLAKFVFSMLASVGSIGALIGILAGNKTVWRYSSTIIRCLGLPAYDLNGDWDGELRSNFVPKGSQKNTLHPNEATMTITQTWLRLVVYTRRKDANTVGKSIIGVVHSNEHGLELFTIYRGEHERPEPGDDQSWFGASNFHYDPRTDKLSGRYCSTAGLSKGDGTVGNFNLARAGDNRNGGARGCAGEY